MWNLLAVVIYSQVFFCLSSMYQTKLCDKFYFPLHCFSFPKSFTAFFFLPTKRNIHCMLGKFLSS